MQIIEETNQKKSLLIDDAIDRATACPPPHDPTTSNIEYTNTDIAQQIKENKEFITINIRNQPPMNPDLFPNHQDVPQNSDSWHESRKFKITGSRFGVLLGLHGKRKYEDYWHMVLNGLGESEIMNTNIPNFHRGHKFEAEAIQYFEALSCSSTKRCGFS